MKFSTDILPRKASYADREPQNLDYAVIRKDPDAVVTEQIVAAFSTQKAAEDYADWMGARNVKGEAV